jgi:hypothetical protein
MSAVARRMVLFLGFQDSMRVIMCDPMLTAKWLGAREPNNP